MTEMATNYKPHKFNRYLCRVYAYRIKPQINGYNIAAVDGIHNNLKPYCLKQMNIIYTGYHNQQVSLFLSR